MVNNAKILAKKFWKNHLVRDVTLLSAGTAGAQALSILSAPIITRLYGPEAYGIFGVFLSFLTILSSMGAMSYPLALPLPQERGEAIQITRISAIAALCFCSLLAVLILIPTSLSEQLQSASRLGEWLHWIPLALLIGTSAQIASQWLVRDKVFKATSTITLANSAWTNAGRIILGFAWPSVAALILTHIAGQILLTARMATVIHRHLLAGQSKNTQTIQSPRALINIAAKYKSFPLYRAPQDFINSVSRGIPIILLSTISGPGAAGLYALATQMVGTPSSLIGNAVTNVLYPEMTQKARENGQLTPAIIKSTGILALLGIAPFGAIILFSPAIFSAIFGDSWAEAGIFSQWLSILYYFNFINKPAVAAIPALGIQRELLIYEIASTTAKLAGLYYGFTYLRGSTPAIALFSIAGAVAYIILILRVIIVSRREKK